MEDSIDVLEEEEDVDPAPGEIVVRQPVHSLPALPGTLGRGPQVPVIPAGIAQATQPQFVHTIFQVQEYGTVNLSGPHLRVQCFKLFYLGRDGFYLTLISLESEGCPRI